ncbi:DUF6603 domain-containing protein [Nocardiopsis aegyptia]|uniref:DUF6603 domain-containing protein n=1 Tax=Nocardiopsis aegyptia TaxID=220378 RepID=A0A7Z0JAL0_9ACTN|nr:DUF6603 domain-containing protein [Nocardiopsis aegyptia]NYJ34519.1 hypothetical protein [Nocardiopsis aegyptia]
MRATSAGEEVSAHERIGICFPEAGGLVLLYDGETSVLACENFALSAALDVMSLPFVPAQARNGAHWSLGEDRSFPSTTSTLSCQLQLDPNDHKLTSVGLLLDVSRALTLFETPEPIVMRNPGAVVNIDLSGASPSTRVTLKGELDFGGLRLFADCTLPQGEFGADLIEVTPAPSGEAGGSAATRLSESALPAFQGLPDLDVASASVTGDARAGTWSAQLNMSGTWKLLNGVGVQDPRFTVTRENVHANGEGAAGKDAAETPPEGAPAGEGGKQIRATAQGTALLGALRVDTTLEHTEDGWHLQGELLRPNPSDVQDWARTGHDTDLGHVLGDVELAGLHLEANTGKGEFSVRCSGRWSVLPQGSTCELDITRGAAERADLTVVLPVAIDGAPHPMTWRGDASRGSERIDLSWKDESGVNLGAVVRALHPGADLPDELLPVVTELSLGYTKHPGTQSPGGSTLTLAVLSDPVSVAVALDHPAANGSQNPGTALAVLTRASLGSSLTASHLPMVGQLIPPDLDAGVSRADLTLTRPRLDAETVRRINTALPETLTLPEPSEGRTPATCLSLTLTLPGKSDSRVSLDLGGGSDAEADTAPRSIPAADAPEVKGAGTSDDSPVQKSSSGAASSDEGEGTASGGDSKPSVSWKDVRRQLGPLDLRKIGLGHHDRKLWLMFDAGLAFAGLSAQTDGLGLGFSPAELRAGQFTPEPVLDGLTVAYSRPPLTLSGGFERWPADDEFDVRLGGTVNVSATKFSLEAVGSYQHARAGWFSLDVIGRLGVKFGEPPVFVVTGLMGGFGYNSRLRVPAITEIDSFPLLTAMTDTAPEHTKDGAEGTKVDTGGTEGTAGAKAEVSEAGAEETKPAEAGTEGEGQTPKGGPDPASAVTERQTALLEQLRGEGEDAWLVPAAGEFWAAAGLTFTAFEMISGEAVLAVGLGDDLSITLIGHADATFPSAKDVPGAAPATHYAVADMDLRVGYLRSQHLFSAEARLTDKTYVVSKDCRVTGGLALYTWMSGPHGGDFVLSIGGYPDGYPVPDHYPRVDRVAIDWTPSTGVVVHGEAYFALTPRAIMAGGALNVSYRSGGLHAWLDLAAHILIAWAPFHFDVGVSVSIGVEYTFHLLFWDVTVGAHFSVEVDLHGPPTGGRVTIDWTVISFHVDFGAPPQGALAQRLSWEEFSSKLLPDQHLMLTPLAGLHTEAPGTGAPGRESVWTVVAHGFSFGMRCAVPATQAHFCDRNITAAETAPEPVSVRPMGVRTTGAYHSVSVESLSGGEPRPLNEEELANWTTTVATGSVPAALWGSADDTGPDHSLVKDQFLGLTCTVAGSARVGEIDLPASVLTATTEPTAPLPLLD